MLERRKFIRKYLNNFTPDVISNLISEYDYYVNGNCEITLKGHFNCIYYCNFVSDNQGLRLVSASHNAKIQIWDALTWNIMKKLTLKNILSRVPCYILPDGRIMKHSNLNDGIMEIWNVHTDNCELTLRHHSRINCCAFLPDERIITGSDDSTLKIWNIKTGFSNTSCKCELTLEGHTDSVEMCRVLSDGRIISASLDNTLKIWNIQNGMCELTMRGHTDSIKDCSILSDGKIISASYDGTLKIWNIKSGSSNTSCNCELTLCEDKYNNMTCYAILSDRRIVSGTSNGTLKIWNISNGKCELILKGHSGTVSCCSVLPDGRIISGSFDDTLKIWNPQIGKCEVTLEGHNDWVSCCAISPDGIIVSGSYDNTLKIWN
jgi:WD40 repeat protein